MIILTLCQTHSELFGAQVRAVVLAHTTPTDSVRTVSGAAFYSLMETPVLKPLMYLAILFSPFVRLLTDELQWRLASSVPAPERFCQRGDMAGGGLPLRPAKQGFPGGSGTGDVGHDTL
jgi:hypothetical protein